jgi:hypothetical protein
MRPLLACTRKTPAQDRKAIEDCRQLLRLSEDNALQFFAAKVYVRSMRLLGADIPKILIIGDAARPDAPI